MEQVISRQQKRLSALQIVTFVAACQVSALQSVVRNGFSTFIDSRATRAKS
jgi:hypothetical protein